jgi:CcmD family protein
MSHLKTDAFAYQGQQKDFVAQSSITRESLPATPFVYAGYGTVWVVIALYVFILGRKLSRVEQDLRDVSAKLAASKR